MSMTSPITQTSDRSARDVSALVLSGSRRSASLNTRLARLAARHLNETGVDVTLFSSRKRVLPGEAGRARTDVVRHRCASCGAVWRTLPLFLARWLWRSWAVVERAVER